MRRRIELWIGSLRADLADDSFILYNYTMEDLTSPAIVKNSFSRQVTLPGTTANNRIFGGISRNDRVTQYHATNETGVNFDPTRKTTWRVYNEKSEILESGYLRLDSVKRRKGAVVEYKVTLYGGLGSFLYGLSYDDNGEKRTLAGLDFLNTGTPDTEFNFPINAASVRAAWERIAAASGTPSQKWDMINFAPAYNGKPSGTFDADKGLLDVVACGIQGSSDGTLGGLALVTLAQEYTEWETKDLRSYLQRPVVRLRSVIEAACASRNNGGWTVNLDSAFFNASNPYWQKTWLTLPIIDTDLTLTDSGGTGSLSFSAVGGDPSVVEAVLSGGGNNNLNYTAEVRIIPFATLSGASSDTLYLHCEEGGTYWMSYVQYTINAYNGQNQLIDSTAVRISSRQPAAEAGDQPAMDGIGVFNGNGAATAQWSGGQVVAAVSGQGLYRIRVTASCVALKWGVASGDTPTEYAMWTNPLSYASLFNAGRYYGDFGGSSFNYGAISGGRSGKTVTKATLLSGGGTPAEYLLALCKTFGLVMVADAAKKTVSVELRRTFYNSTVVDISDRIDMDTGLEKVPFAFDAKWYVWAAQYESGEWAKIYAEKYGRTFGQMRVDTGYGFDANTNKVLDGCLFHGAVMALECEKYFCKVEENGHTLPAVLLDRGAKYSVTRSLTQKEEIDINLPSDSATITWMNTALPSYDLYPKPQFHDKDNAAFDERDTMLFFNGMTSFGSGSSIVDVPLTWQAMTHPQDNRSSKYIDVAVKTGDVITVRLNDYSTWRFAGVVLTAKEWGSGNFISDTGWQTADLTKTVTSAENGYYFRITVSRQDNGNFSAAEAEAVLAEATAIRRVQVTTQNNPYTLTDDTPAMLTLNEGTPCWLLQWAAHDEDALAPELPKFSRYLDYSEQHQGFIYERSLDFGVPAEVPIPGVTFRDGSTIWPWYFAEYIADRYDDDSAVVRCKVNLAGMQVGPDLMRQFYWFDGAVWSLNKIINHSMTTWDLTECEFVKVQDIDNYTT